MVRIPSDSQACTVSIVSVWEFPDEKVVQTTPVGAELGGQRRGHLGGELLLGRPVEIAGREDHADEPQRRCRAPACSSLIRALSWYTAVTLRTAGQS